MPKYKFVSDTEAMIRDLNGAVLQPNQVFDPADYGVPDWTPEPNPHPLFAPVGPQPKSKPESPALQE